TTVVGYGYGLVTTADSWHALLWNGTPDSVIDLHPSNYVQSYAYAASVAGQVGYGIARPQLNDHALYWNGSASSVVDLHQFLSPTFGGSIAYGTNDEGVIVGDRLIFKSNRLGSPMDARSGTASGTIGRYRSLSGCKLLPSP